MKLIASAFAALALWASVGQSAPLDVKAVAADAKWVVHVDVDAIRDSQIVQKTFDSCPEMKNAGVVFDLIRSQIGVDLRKDLHGITAYGPDGNETHVVAIVDSTVDKKLLLDKVVKAAGHKVTKHGDVEIHSWTDKHGSKTHTVAGAFYKDDVLVFAASEKGVAAAIDVLDGKVAGITEARSPLAGRVAAGTTFIARAIVNPDDPKCEGLKQFVSFRVALGEHDGKSFYRGSAVMKTPKAAEQMKAIVEGGKAMGALTFTDDADAMKLVDGLKITVRDSTIRVRWEASVDDVWTVAQKLAKKAAEHFKAHGPHPKDGKKTSVNKKTSVSGEESPVLKATSAGSCPAGCQCPVCNAKAEAKAASSKN